MADCIRRYISRVSRTNLSAHILNYQPSLQPLPPSIPANVMLQMNRKITILSLFLSHYLFYLCAQSLLPRCVSFVGT